MLSGELLGTVKNIIYQVISSYVNCVGFSSKVSHAKQFHKDLIYIHVLIFSTKLRKSALCTVVFNDYLILVVELYKVKNVNKVDKRNQYY